MSKTYSSPVGPVQGAEPAVRVTSQTATYTYVEWDVVPGAYGYRLFLDDVPKSVTFDGTAHATRFKVTGHHRFEVLPLVAGKKMGVSS